MLHKTSESMDVQTQGGATNFENICRKIVSSNTSHLEANVGFFRLLMKKGIFGPYVL